MGLFDFLRPYISREKFERNTSGQKRASKKWKETVMAFEDNPEAAKQLEFFFYAKEKERALQLKKDLEKKGYRVYGIAPAKDRQFSIIGLTTPLSLSDQDLEQWIEKMNELGFINDCFFDGWGMISHLE